MDLQRPFFFFLCFCLSLSSLLITGSCHGKHQINGFRPTKLFVFGDSYSDTGNNRKSEANSWKAPYGITFPGKPAGRFSDGRVLTDYVAKFVGIKSPVPYKWRKYVGKKVSNGMNFAYGGTGVFDTLVMEPNMTSQIDLFEKLIKNCSFYYSGADLASSIALFTVSGNDYGAYYAMGGTPQGLQKFITSVINQLAANLKRVHELGVRKIAAASLPPLGCLPMSTIVSSFQQCNATQNSAVNFHNALLQNAVEKLNNQTTDSAFFVLDLYTAFTTALKSKGEFTGGLKFETPLKPCCMGIKRGNSCGSIDNKGGEMYRVCSNPKSAFFWDMVHPTQAGWDAVFSSLKTTLQQIY